MIVLAESLERNRVFVPLKAFFRCSFSVELITVIFRRVIMLGKGFILF
jgi:hypothetical protein